MDDPLVIENEGFSLIWLVPIIALLIGGWMGYQQYQAKPTVITIHFPDGDGINSGKTEVRYKGLTAGVVSDLALEEDGAGVLVSVEMDHRFEPYLSEETDFWLVRPEIGVSGIKGLETLVSGNYIGIRPVKGSIDLDFVALDGPPPLSANEPGLHIRLTAPDLGSLSVGSPVTYKKIIVGSVQDYKLHDEGVTIDLFIKPNFSHLVKKGSRFWNSSGVFASGGLSGFEIQTDALATIIAGGVSFHTPEQSENAQAANNDEYSLFKDYKRASAGILTTIQFSSAEGLVAESTELRYNGLHVGIVREIEFDQDKGVVNTTVVFDPQFEFLLVKGAAFWLVKPELSLSGISGLDTIISGNYIEVAAGKAKAEPKYSFVALSQAPKMDYSVPGLHIKIVTDLLPSISHGSPILYRKVQVGEVQSYGLTKDGKRIEIHAHIDKKYAHLVKRSSRFWNASGIRVKGGLGGIKIQTETLTTLLRGGLSFYTPQGKSKKAKNGTTYELYEGIDEAQEEGVSIQFSVETGDGLKEGTEIRYQGIQVGAVKSVQLDKNLKSVVVHALLNPDARALAVKGSVFWRVKPELGLAHTANLDTLVSGQYITLNAGEGNLHYEFELLDKAPTQKQENTGLNVVLLAPNTQSIKAGVHVFYRQVTVGEVTGVELSNNADHVRIYINIEEPYRPLVRSNSKFWNTSGIDINFKLFGGASFRTDSFESILEGGIAFATPNNDTMGDLAKPQDRFKLYPEVKESWLAWKPKIALNR
ncbi:hypothetical protein A9Q99_15325 [Gammaproteobacteria bacterium 45_16_T64]|nr:hypothetical protein A9Q99_15325 [Gammaproteobacteria bacterium 45_16_T64]